MKYNEMTTTNLVDFLNTYLNALGAEKTTNMVSTWMKQAEGVKGYCRT